MMSGCSQGSHIFEVVFIRDRRQPTFTIVADVNGSFFLFSQCPRHCYSFACDELSQVGDAFSRRRSWPIAFYEPPENVEKGKMQPSLQAPPLPFACSPRPSR